MSPTLLGLLWFLRRSRRLPLRVWRRLFPSLFTPPIVRQLLYHMAVHIIDNMGPSEMPADGQDEYLGKLKG